MKHLNRLIVLAVAGAALAGCAHTAPDVPLAAPIPVTTPAADRWSESPAAEPPSWEPPSTEAPIPEQATTVPEKSDLVGTQYGFLTDVDPGARSVTFDKVEWFTGAAARKACKADGVRITDNAMCNDYYIRNHNPKLRTAMLASDAKLSLQSPNDIMVQLETSLDGLAAERQDRLFILTFSGGKVSRIKEQFLA